MLESEKFEALEKILFEDCIVNSDEYGLVVSINGKSVETLEAILFARTGYRSLEQYPVDDECIADY